MKCAYKQVQQERLNAEAQEPYDEMSVHFLRLLDAAAGITLHEQSDPFGKVRLKRFYEEVMLQIWEDLEFYKAFPKDLPEHRKMFTARVDELKERAQNRDSIESTLWVSVRELNAIGYDFEAVERETAYRVPDKWCSPSVRRLRDARAAYVERIQPTCRVYIAAAMLHLHQRYGYGAARLVDKHRAIREKHNRFVEMWCDLRDDPAFKLLNGWMEQVEKYGAEVTYWKGNKDERSGRSKIWSVDCDSACAKLTARKKEMVVQMRLRKHQRQTGSVV